MHIFNKVIELSRKIAASLLKDENSTDLESSKIFSKSDKEYILKNLTDESAVKERFNLANQIDKNADWKTVKSKIAVPVRKLYWNYAAAVAVVVGMLSSAYFFKDDLFNDSSGNKSIIVTTILKGTDKATLTLEDGSEVALEKGKSLQTKNANSDGKQIVYDKTDNKTSKIAYNYLTIPRGGEFFIKLSDGTQIWLNSESQLKYPVAFTDGETRRVELIYGEAYFDVSHSSNHSGSKFKVKFKNQEVTVFGTEFNIKAYRDENRTYTTLISGAVKVGDNISQHILTPGQQLIASIESGESIVKNIDITYEIAWKNGLFIFKEMRLDKMMKILSRWYNTDIRFDNNDKKELTFSGILERSSNVDKLIDNIQGTNKAEFKIEGNLITIR